ncbi:MAG: NUDIX hydrolase [Rhodocyclaceae bacterium]|nr:NUDIX hydrolase [Rhodocyclaceae bacterium]
MLKVYRDTVRLPDGGSATREYIKHPGAVVIVAVLPDGKLIFERQFRYPLDRVFLELPAGKLDPDETILACAQRELLEETGYRADHWQHLGVMHPCIGYSDERIEIFFARDLHFEGQKLDDGEFLEIVSMNHAEVEAAVMAGKITDGKTISALFVARTLLGA